MTGFGEEDCDHLTGSASRYLEFRRFVCREHVLCHMWSCSSDANNFYVMFFFNCRNCFLDVKRRTGHKLNQRLDRQPKWCQHWGRCAWVVALRAVCVAVCGGKGRAALDVGGRLFEFCFGRTVGDVLSLRLKVRQ